MGIVIVVFFWKPHPIMYSCCDVSVHLTDKKEVIYLQMAHVISKWLSISCLFSVETTQLNDFDTDSNENGETQQI